MSELYILDEKNNTILRYNYDTLALLVLVLSMSTVAFYLVQGSEPGYLNEQILQAMYKEKEKQGLLRSEDEQEDIDEKINGIGDKKTRVHRKRIHKYEVELSKVTTAIDLEKKTLAEFSMLEGEEEMKMNDIDEDDIDLEANTDQKDIVDKRSRMDFCAFCKIDPPLRSHHCRHCDTCVSTFDHHCFCIGTCIGEKNHCRFLWLLLCASLESCCALSITHSSFHSEKDFTEWCRTNSVAIAGAMIFWVIALFFVPLFLFHTFLMFSSLTTYEIAKGTNKLSYLEGTNECDLPFSNGILGNVQGFCCIRDGFWNCIGSRWTPTIWKPIGRIERNSENICDNLWENKYYSCC